MRSLLRNAPSLPSVLLVLLAICTIPSIARAQPISSGAVSTFLDPSVQASGMGRAGTAVFWWDDPDEWANPALLGYHQGVRYSYGRTQLVPDLAEEVFFTSQRVVVAAGGVGVSFAGKPIHDLGKYRLDYGTSEATNENGDVVGEFNSFEDVRQIGVGISLFRTLETLVAANDGDAPEISRYFDISLGHAWKDVLLDLAPANVVLSIPTQGEATEMDRGALIRVTPFGSRSRRQTTSTTGVRLDLAAAYSQRNYDDSQISYSGAFGSDPIAEERLIGTSGRFTVNLPSTSDWVWRVLTPEISVGAAWDRARYYDGGVEYGQAIDRTGQEISILGVLSGRHGYVDDPSGGIQDDTWGYSVALQYRGMFGARYDWAQVPQAEFLRDVTRSGFSVSFDPLRIWQVAREDQAKPAHN